VRVAQQIGTPSLPDPFYLSQNTGVKTKMRSRMSFLLFYSPDKIKELT
jgi:hypothetical protein